MNIRIGEYLKSIREEKKLSLRDAAELSGLSHSYIRYLEKGMRPGSETPINPTPDTLERLSKAYNHPYKDLMIKAGYWKEGDNKEVSKTKNRLYDVIARAEDLPEEKLDTVADALEALIKFHQDKLKRGE